MVRQYRQLEKEIQVTYILKQLRVLKTLFREKLTRTEWRQAYHKYGHLGNESSSEDNLEPAQEASQHRHQDSSISRSDLQASMSPFQVN